jgi:hypothetical protein
MVDHLIHRVKPISWRALAIAVGVLESVVEATPSRLGHTYLQSLYDTLHPSGFDDTPYNTSTLLNDTNRLDLEWWRSTLLADASRPCKAPNSGTLIPTFGDGSGMGTGGTIQYPDEPMKMWTGAWSPRVWHFSSNWKELRTLLATLQHAEKDNKPIGGSTLFYFTDNLVTYYIVSSGSSCSPELHRLIVAIKTLEQKLDIVLEAVHVPGTSIITQGTDGLSRGIWCSPLHDRPDQKVILELVFAPIPHSPQLTAWACREAHVSPPVRYHHVDWASNWHPRQVIGKHTIWTSPPEIAAQLLYDLLTCYIADPLNTSFMCLLLWVLQRRWGQSSRHVHEVGVFARDKVPLVHSSILQIPVVLLHVTSHSRVLPDPSRMDRPSPTPAERWHRQQAAPMRGLPPANLALLEAGLL